MQNVPMNWSRLVSVLQTIVLISTVAVIFISVGKQAATIDDTVREVDSLRQISMDLVKAQVLGQERDLHHSGVLIDLKRRLESLETRQR